MANLITILRILASAALLFCPALSPAFFAVYIFAGITDALDGFVARRTGTASDLGAKLDTIADLVLAAVCLCKLLPILDLSGWLYGWIALIALIKAVNIVSGYVVEKRFISLHTPMNKATGVLLFLLPLTLSCIELKYTAILLCAVATFAAIQEGHFIRTGRRE